MRVFFLAMLWFLRTFGYQWECPRCRTRFPVARELLSVVCPQCGFGDKAPPT